MPSTQALNMSMYAVRANATATMLVATVLTMLLKAKKPIVLVHLCASSGATHDETAQNCLVGWQQWIMQFVVGFAQPG